MSKADRILGRFPACYRARDSSKRLHQLVRKLAEPLEEADTLLFRIRRSHRLLLAEQAEDIVRLAAVLNLAPFHFEDLLADPSPDYDAKLDRMRHRVRRVALLHLDGLGTPWAILESAAIFLDAEIVPDRPGGPAIAHVCPDGTSHRATLAFQYPGESRHESLFLHENPYHRRKIDPQPRWAHDTWPLSGQTVEPLPVRIAIQGVADRTVFPSVVCQATGRGILFRGLVPDGTTLVLDPETGAALEGRRVDDWLVSFQGGLFDFRGSGARWDQHGYVTEDEGESPPPAFDGDWAQLLARPLVSIRTMPTAPPGPSDWAFRVVEGVHDGTAWDQSVFTTPAEPIGTYDGDCHFDSVVFDYPPSGVVGMSWDERIPCAFKLLLPDMTDRSPKTQPAAGAKEPSPSRAGSTAGPINAVGRIGQLLPRFQAAGIRAFVDSLPDAWVLGQSVLRGGDSREGEGVAWHATRIRRPRADQFVSLDPPGPVLAPSPQSANRGDNSHGD